MCSALLSDHYNCAVTTSVLNLWGIAFVWHWTIQKFIFGEWTINTVFFFLTFQCLSLFRYQDLLKEEKATINELSLLERKVELWALGSSTAEKIWKLPLARVTVDKTLKNHLPEEVIEFERFLQRTGGRQGGWDDYDHQNFLKIRTKYRGRLSYMDEALEYLSGRTKEDIEQHDKWYQEYVILHERKKEVK